MAKDKITNSDIHTPLPLTSEARETLLDSKFAGVVPHYGQLFIPDDAFYGNQNGMKQAKHMLGVLCHWLGVKPGYIGLKLPAGKHTAPDGRKLTIEIGPSVLNDEFVLGAFMAYNVTRYLVEQRAQITTAKADQPNMLATASIVLGLGLVISNGLSPKYSWVNKPGDQNVKLLDDFSESHYLYMLRSFIKKHRVNPISFIPYVAPWTAKQLGIKSQPNASKAVLEIRHKIFVTNLKIIAVAWLVVMIFGISGFVISKRVRPEPTTAIQAQAKITELNDLRQECESTLTYNRQYADLADIQTVRKLNADQVNCQSLKNQQTVAEQSYQKLLHPR